MADDKFNIEEFPTSETAKQMISRVSPIYDKSYVGKWLFQVMGLEMDEARALVESLRDQTYLERCTWGMRYWEERYGIEVDETKDLEERRAAVMAKRGSRRPLSPAALEDILETLTGRGVSIEEQNESCSFVVSLDEGDSAVDYTALISKIEAAKPSHLAYSIELPRKGTLTLYLAAAMYEVKNIELTDYDRRGVTDAVWLVDELNNTLADENGNVFVEK